MHYSNIINFQFINHINQYRIRVIGVANLQRDLFIYLNCNL